MELVLSLSLTLLPVRAPQALRSFKVIISVDPKFHPKIIGRKGAVISQIRKDHDVNIQFPDKGDEQQVCHVRLRLRVLSSS